MTEAIKEEKVNNKPTKKWRIGTVQLTEWTNTNSDGNEFTTYTIENSYVDKETKEFKPSKSFSTNQLHALKDCIEKANMERVK